jgi:hypothetical protein
VTTFIKVGAIFLNVEQITEVQDQSNGDGISCHVWLTDGRSHGFKGAEAQSVLDAMTATQSNGSAALMDELPLP